MGKVWKKFECVLQEIWGKFEVDLNDTTSKLLGRHMRKLGENMKESEPRIQESIMKN